MLRIANTGFHKTGKLCHLTIENTRKMSRAFQVGRHRCTVHAKRSRCVVLGLYLIFGSTASVMAEWSGGIEGGTVARSTGTATSLRLALRNNGRPFSQYIFAEWLRGSQGGNSFSVGYNPRYWLSDRNYVFGESELSTDDVFGIDREIYAVAGVGRQFFSTPDQSLYAEVGVGGRTIDFADTEDVSGDALGIVRLGFQRKIIDLVRLDLQSSASRSSSDVTDATAEAGVALRIANGGVRVAYRTRFLKVDELDSITEDDTFVSFSYGF